MVQVPRMHLEIISVDGDRSVFEADDYLYRIALGTCREIEQRMLV
jgi:hypothetical protein